MFISRQGGNQGYAQKEDVNYNKVFSLVVKHTSIRLLLAMVAHFDLELEQLNVKTTFLHEDLEEEIYISQPEGFKVVGKKNSVYKLRKSYGLKQSPHQWYKRFDTFMLMQSLHGMNTIIVYTSRGSNLEISSIYSYTLIIRSLLLGPWWRSSFESSVKQGVRDEKFG